MKRKIKKYLANKVGLWVKNNPKLMDNNKKRFLFMRWLAEVLANEYESTLVIYKIASYLNTNNATYSFTDIFTAGDHVFIVTRHAGMWIRKGGCIIEEIANLINTNAKGEKTHNYELTTIDDHASSVSKMREAVRVYNVSPEV